MVLPLGKWNKGQVRRGIALALVAGFLVMVFTEPFIRLSAPSFKFSYVQIYRDLLYVVIAFYFSSRTIETVKKKKNNDNS